MLRFWGWMDKEIKAGRIVSAERVYKEVVEGRKLRTHSPSGCNHVRLTESVKSRTSRSDKRIQEIGDYVNTNSQYPVHQKLELFRGADAWIIAHAWVHSGTVVSNESGNLPNSQRVRIPDICHKFKVRHINRDALTLELHAQF